MRSRKGLTVENSNTDAEGRLILGDALAKGGREQPELVIDFATLTRRGAGRARRRHPGPVRQRRHAPSVPSCWRRARPRADPIWRLPLWTPYEELLKSDVADMVNAAEGPWAAR
ncbi:MAG: hypothetical protein WDN44_10405 [Sphingomonas sp.]